MKENIQKDERVLAYRRKIQSDAYMYLIFYLAAVLLIKIFILRTAWHDYITELIALLGANLYMGIRNIYVGNDIMRTHNKTKDNLYLSLFSGFIITGTAAFLTYDSFVNKTHFFILLLVIYAVTAVIAFTLRLLWSSINKRRINALEKKYDDDE